ncbi:MaoC family dehydratase [Nocardia alni]|uniref:MaoC family dehydratase n=1 Tax=Nocardia alni TaxID=2815723 RepID=UPI001C228BE7|nr:MaoC family dehydratase [Nocardia alni]
MTGTGQEPNLADFPIRKRGAYFEKFTVGEVFEHHWGRTITSADNTIFCTALAHWTPMYLNTEYARAHGHKDAVLNPFLVLCTVVGLSVEDLSESGGPFLGIEQCVFERPLYAGDTIRAESVVTQARPSGSRPGYGIVTWQTTAFDQHEQVVLHFIRKNLLAGDQQR